jgi:hypothetical protein
MMMLVQLRERKDRAKKGGGDICQVNDLESYLIRKKKRTY